LPAFLVISIGIALWAAGGIVAGGVALIVIGILAFTAVALLNQALATIFGVALYHYAASDRAVSVFTTEDFAEAVTVKGGMPPGTAGTTI
ncbi:MAG: hypothetical protein ACKOB2_01015, partial [Solirubrobacterales bacterium]